MVATFRDANRTLHGTCAWVDRHKVFYTYQWASRYGVDDHRDRLHGRHTGGFNPVAANFTVDSDTQITAIVPGGASTGRSA